MGREVSGHERNRHEEDGDFGEEYGDACEALHRMRFFERYEIEVLPVPVLAYLIQRNLDENKGPIYQKDQRLLFVKALLYFAERVVLNSIA